MYPAKEQGHPLQELRIRYLLPGQVVKITEDGETTTLTGAELTLKEHQRRQYDVAFLQAQPPSKTETQDEQPVRVRRLVRDQDDRIKGVGQAMTRSELEKAMVGQVSKITETVTRCVYRGGLLLTKNQTDRVFKVNLEVGFN